MLSASLLVQARRSAGLSQRALGERAGVAQQEIARYERGHVTPSLERLRALIAACGLELTVGLARADASYDEQIVAALALTSAARLERALRDVQPLRAARAPAQACAEVLGVLRALAEVGVVHVLIGELAEVAHGSPLLPISASVRIVPRVGQRERLSGVIGAAAGKPTAAPASWMIDAPMSFALDAYASELVVEAAPSGTQGYEDLRRDATALKLGEGLEVTVASLLDLVRIAEAGEDRARVPALRRTLELATAPPAVRAA